MLMKQTELNGENKYYDIISVRLVRDFDGTDHHKKNRNAKGKYTMTQRYTFGGGVLNIGLDEQEILKGLESNRNYISLLRKISNNLAIEIKGLRP